MAIIKRAENIYVSIKNEHYTFSKKIVVKADLVIVDALSENLTLNCNKKVISNGRK